jgi:hypothetical protein
MTELQKYLFEHWCMSCGQKIGAVTGSEYLGGWIPHEDCGYETLFKAATSTGRCEQISTRKWSRASHSLDSHTMSSFEARLP